MFSKFGDNSLRIKFYKMLSLYEYLNLINISDIVLDTFPFGGCNSSLEALYLNKPIVTMPSNKLSGRFTYGFYKYINLEDCIAKDKLSYINICIKLVNDKVYYNKIKDYITKEKHVLFEDRKSIDEWNEILYNLKKYN